MADPKVGVSSGVDAQIERLKQLRREIDSIKGAISGDVQLKAKVVIDTKEADREFEKLGKKAKEVIRITRADADTFVQQKASVVRVLNAAQGQSKPEERSSLYSRANFSPDLASEAELIRIQRQRSTLLKRISDTAQGGNIDDVRDIVNKYNAIADPKHKLSTTANIAELDFQSYNQWGSLSRQIGSRENRLVYRSARNQGLISDKSSLTDKEIDSRVAQMASKLGGAQGELLDTNTLARNVITTRIGQVPLHIQAAMKAGLLPIQPEVSTGASAESILARIEEQKAASAALEQPQVKIPGYAKALAALRRKLKDERGFALNPFGSLRQVGGREFEVTGELPPVRTEPYPPTLLEMQQGITQQQIDRERAAAGLPRRDARGRFIKGGGGPPLPPILPPIIDDQEPAPGGGGGGKGRGGLLSRLGGRFTSLGLYGIAASVIYPILTSIRSAFEAAGELEVVMKRIQAIYGGHTLGEQLEIKSTVVDVALKLSSNLVETARTAQLLAQEQIPIGKLAENLTAIAQGSVGLGISQEGLANFVIAVRNLTAPDVKPVEGPELINLISAFVRKGAVTPQNLTTAIQQVLPALEPFSPNTTAINDPALIAAITSRVARTSGYTGSQVANTLKYMIAKFGNPKVARDIEDRAGIGLGTKESGGQELRPYIEILQDLANAYQHLINTGQTAAAQNLLKDISNSRQTGVAALILKEFAKSLEEAGVAIKDTGAAAELAAIQQDTWKKSIERLSTVGTLIAGPILTGIKSLGGTIIEWLVKPIEGWYLLIKGGVDLLARARDATLNIGKGAETPEVKWAREHPFHKGIEIYGPTQEQAGISTTPGAPLYSDKEFIDFYYNIFQKRTQLLAGQQQTAKDFGALFSSPKRNLTELTSLLDRFYEAIHIDEREKGESIFAFIDRKTGNDSSTNKKMKETYNLLHQELGPALTLERSRLEGISGFTQGARVEDALARSLDQSNRFRRRLARTFGRRGIDDFPIQTMRQELEEISAGRLSDIQRENAAYAVRRHLLEVQPDFLAKPTQLREAELTALSQEHLANLKIIDDSTIQLSIQAEINATYESRLKDLQQIDTLEKQINSDVQSAIFGLPGKIRERGVFRGFISSLIEPIGANLFKTLISNIQITGPKGLFPELGAGINKVIGQPSLTQNIPTPWVTLGGQVIVGSSTVLKSPEQIRKDQIRQQIRAVEIAVGATVGAYVGRGGPGAQAGAQIGAIGATALIGTKLGAAGGPIGAIVGGLIGGLLGGLLDKKPKPELTALEKIAANTGESITLIENTNRLLELQNIAFNVPTGFTLPRFGPSLFGGQSTIGGSSVNVEVNIGGSSASPQQIGNVVAQAVANVLEGEYRSGGRYVARTTY